MPAQVRTALALAMLASLCSGCIVVAAAAVGAAAYGAISYHENEATMDVQQDLPTVFDAARAAMRALDFPVDGTQRPGKTEATLTGGDAHVRVELHPNNVTRVRARVGTFDTEDNRRRARLILQAIKERL